MKNAGVEILRFTNHPGWGYRVDRPDFKDQSGEYVRVSDYRELEKAFYEAKAALDAVIELSVAKNVTVDRVVSRERFAGAFNVMHQLMDKEAQHDHSHV